MARWRFGAALGLAAAALFTVVGVAAAIIVPNIPNAGFEQGPPCSPLPATAICGWNDLVGTMTQDTIHNTGSFSMKLTNGSGTSVEATTAGGVCVSPISPGTHASSFWYMTASPVVDIQLGAHWFPNADCTVATFGNSALHAPMPLTYGAWTQVIGTLTAPPGTGSAFFSVFASCQCSTPGTITAYFDDVGFETSTTAVSVGSLTASRSTAGVRLRWRTGTEADLLGFQVYRSRGHSWKRLTRTLIPAKGSVSGASYRFLDRTARRGVAYRYRIKALNRDATASWFGPVPSHVSP